MRIELYLRVLEKILFMNFFVVLKKLQKERGDQKEEKRQFVAVKR